MISEREQFAAVLSSGPLLRGDAIVLLAGDGQARIGTAVELLRQRAGGVLVVSGGLDNPPYSLAAGRVVEILIGMGVNPACLRTDDAQNTHEQAVATIALAESRGWTRLLLVASPYHMARAYLTFLRVLLDRGLAESIHLVAVPTSQSPWFKAPEGQTATRLALLDDETAKVTRYAEHVASYADGLRYLEQWESA